MQKRFENIAIIVLIVVVIFLGTITIFQQKDINQIKSDVVKEKNSVPNSLREALSTGVNSDKINAQDNSQQVFPGEIKALSGNILEVDAKLVKADNESQIRTGQYYVVTKTVKVAVNDKTEFFGAEKEKIAKDNLKVGDKMFVTADSSPFQEENLTAIKISLINDWPAQLNLK